MKIISYCLYGSNPKYYFGVIKNIKLAKSMLQDWTCFIYHNNTLEEKLIKELSVFENAKLINTNKNDNGMFWRFFPFYENDENICISRDADSRITEREVDCLNKWLDSEKKFHIIRDHHQHYNMPIMGGMWGMKGRLGGNVLENMNNIIDSCSFYYGKDQEWLANIWELAKKDCLIHGIKEDDWFKETRKNMKDPFNFIGNGWTEEEKPVYHYEDHGMKIN
jgi:hypothetical protein